MTALIGQQTAFSRLCQRHLALETVVVLKTVPLQIPFSQLVSRCDGDCMNTKPCVCRGLPARNMALSCLA